eukprot:6723732-Prymnesium_polylepis.2
MVASQGWCSTSRTLRRVLRGSDGTIKWVIEQHVWTRLDTSKAVSLDMSGHVWTISGLDIRT